jgi:hypothetical protein
MPLSFQIDLSDTATKGLRAWREGLAQGVELHQAMGFGVQAATKAHLESEGYTGRVNKLGGKSTGFWKSVAESITTDADATSATVTYNHRGVALRYFGGTVSPTTRKALSVPVHKSAHGLNASEYPDKLAFIPATRQFGPFRAGGGQDTVGYLVRGVERTVTRGKNKGKTRVVPMARPAGELIYVLRRRTHHEPDRNIVPTDAKLIEAARNAALDYLDSFED